MAGNKEILSLEEWIRRRLAAKKPAPPSGEIAPGFWERLRGHATSAQLAAESSLAAIVIAVWLSILFSNGDAMITAIAVFLAVGLSGLALFIAPQIGTRTKWVWFVVCAAVSVADGYFVYEHYHPQIPSPDRADQSDLLPRPTHTPTAPTTAPQDTATRNPSVGVDISGVRGGTIKNIHTSGGDTGIKIRDTEGTVISGLRSDQPGPHKPPPKRKPNTEGHSEDTSSPSLPVSPNSPVATSTSADRDAVLDAIARRAKLQDQRARFETVRQSFKAYAARQLDEFRKPPTLGPPLHDGGAYASALSYFREIAAQYNVKTDFGALPPDFNPFTPRPGETYVVGGDERKVAYRQKWLEFEQVRHTIEILEEDIDRELSNLNLIIDNYKGSDASTRGTSKAL